jgi:hypothetical protein
MNFGWGGTISLSVEYGGSSGLQAEEVVPAGRLEAGPTRKVVPAKGRRPAQGHRGGSSPGPRRWWP